MEILDLRKYENIIWYKIEKMELKNMHFQSYWSCQDFIPDINFENIENPNDYLHRLEFLKIWI